MKKTVAGSSELKKWLLTRKRSGHTWEQVGAMIGVSRGHACLIANGKAEPTPQLLARWNRLWIVSRTTMRRTLPRLVRALQARTVDVSQTVRVYGRGGRRITPGEKIRA